MAENSEKFEFPREKRERDDSEMAELAAEYRAMPLRTIVSVERESKSALLTCGHRKSLLVWLRDGDSVRCRDCYDDQMTQAQRMIDGISG